MSAERFAENANWLKVYGYEAGSSPYASHARSYGEVQAEIGEVQRLFAASDRDVFFESVAHQIRAVAAGGMIGLSRKLMDRMPALEIIAVNGIGTDAVDLDEARRRGVRVTTTPDVLTDDVADMAMALRRSVDFVRVVALFAPGVGLWRGCRLHVE